MENYSARYSSCCLWQSGTACGGQCGLHSLFTFDELNSKKLYIFDHEVSDYMLIKSRYTTFHENALICPRHRYLFCEGYVPEKRCTYYRCYRTKELMQMGVGAALFIGYIPIRKCMFWKELERLE